MAIYPLRMGAAVGLAAVLGGLSILAACDSGPSVLPARDHSPAAVAEATRAVRDRPAEMRREADAGPVPTIAGKPIWSANRKNTAQENARSHFERNGADFGARDVDSFVATAHAFVTEPPKGSLTLKRANGDRLIYDPKGNVFAVVTRDGAPRTLFKPDDGMAYWDKQKAREAEFASKPRRNGDAEG